MAAATIPEPMNASPHHSKVKVSLTLPYPTFVAGEHVAGKMEMECRADQGLGIGDMMVELFAVQELTSRDHSATSTFLHSRRLFQGPGLPPSNAVQAYPTPGDSPLPPHYYQARRGRSTFLFRIPIPASSPSAINFASGLAKVKYELRASVAVFWKGERRLVTDKQDLDVVEAYEENFARAEPEGVVVGENGKFWMQGKVIGGLAVSGESACIHLQVKNHSNKKNTGLSLSLIRTLVLPGVSGNGHQLLQLTDTLTTVHFRGPEYIITPGAEGVASLVFDVPINSRGVKGGIFDGDESEERTTEAIFEIKPTIEVKMSMGLTSKDIILNIPITIVHPAALPELPPAEPMPTVVYPYYPIPDYNATPAPVDYGANPYLYPALPMSPPYIDQNQVWLANPMSPAPFSYMPYPDGHQPHYVTPPMTPGYIPRPVSAGPSSTSHASIPGLHSSVMPPPLPLELSPQQPVEAEEGKGERALRVSQHLRLSSRHRSVSPQSHRFPIANAQPQATPLHFRDLPHLSLLATDPYAISPPSPGIVHSPRPQLTPKHSFTIDPIAKLSRPKSEHVEGLERMADEVAKLTKDLSGDLPRPVTENNYTDITKTLPIPPVPTKKDKHLSRPLDNRTRVDTYFTATATESPAEPLPATPTLTPMLPNRLRTNHHKPDNSESGLDALERRLLAEVGTRKFDMDEKRPDVRTVLPIDIPTKSPEPLNDSAISSLALADHAPEKEPDHDSDGKTHRAGKSNVSGDEGPGGHELQNGKPTRGRSEAPKMVREKEGKKTEKKERHKDDRMRKSAKGRVAAWLGGIDPDVPPPEDVIPSSPSVARAPSALHVDATNGETMFPLDSEIPSATPQVDGGGEGGNGVAASAPNPRSSGFVPIGSLKQESFQRLPVIQRDMTVVEEAKRIADLWSSNTPTKRLTTSPMATPMLKPKRTYQFDPPTKTTPQSIKTDRNISPSTSDTLDGPILITNHARNARKSSATAKPPVPRKDPLLLARFPALSPKQGLGPNYDVRSARGGRGGMVTAVTSIWASPSNNSQVSPNKDSRKPTVHDVPVHPKPRRAPPKHVSTDPSKANLDLPLSKAPANKDGQIKARHGILTPTHLRPAQAGKPSVGATVILTPSEPKLVGLAGKRSRPIIKSTSVPAIISSSHAVPTLSTTASLARPQPSQPEKVHRTTLSPMPSTNTPATAKTPVPPVAKSNTTGELAFGQARLRDLIKKYQGQT